jgi:hypothetical protein
MQCSGKVLSKVKPMEKAEFISVEDDEPDLILSFALHDDDRGVKSLNLLRTPLYEGILPPEERGITVSMEGGCNDHRNMLEEIHIDNNRVRIQASYERYEVDISAIEKSEYDEMMKIVKQLNFDSCFRVVLA